MHLHHAILPEPLSGERSATRQRPAHLGRRLLRRFSFGRACQKLSGYVAPTRPTSERPSCSPAEILILRRDCNVHDPDGGGRLQGVQSRYCPSLNQFTLRCRSDRCLPSLGTQNLAFASVADGTRIAPTVRQSAYRNKLREVAQAWRQVLANMAFYAHRCSFRYSWQLSCPASCCRRLQTPWRGRGCQPG